MGLDQYALYREPQTGEVEEFETWRKHHALHNWMENLWNSKGRPYEHKNSEQFNCVPLELTLEDLDALEKERLRHKVNPEDDRYLLKDLGFIAAARKHIENGMQVAYDSFW